MWSGKIQSMIIYDASTVLSSFLYAMKLFYCHQDGFSHFSESKQGLRTQFSQQHNTKSRSFCKGMNSNEFTLSLPNTLHAPGERLPADRDTNALLGNRPSAGWRNQSCLERDALSFSPSPKHKSSMATEKPYKELSTLMIEFTKRTSTSFGNKFFKVI